MPIFRWFAASGDNHLKKMPVLDHGKVVGVINRSDITQYAMKSYLEREGL